VGQYSSAPFPLAVISLNSSPTRGGSILLLLTHLWGEVRRGGKSQQGITSGTPAPEASMRDYLVRILFVVLKGYGNV
jgi:hypothetical protein